MIAPAEQRDLSARLALKLDFHLIESKFGGWEHALSNRHADGILFLRERIDMDQYQSPHSLPQRPAQRASCSYGRSFSPAFPYHRENCISGYFLTFLSERSVSKTGDFQRELRYALEQQALRPPGTIFIIPLLLENCTPPASLSDIQWLDATRPDWYGRLKSVVTRIST